MVDSRAEWGWGSAWHRGAVWGCHAALASRVEAWNPNAEESGRRQEAGLGHHVAVVENHPEGNEGAEDDAEDAHFRANARRGPPTTTRRDGSISSCFVRRSIGLHPSRLVAVARRQREQGLPLNLGQLSG